LDAKFKNARCEAGGLSLKRNSSIGFRPGLERREPGSGAPTETTKQSEKNLQGATLVSVLRIATPPFEGVTVAAPAAPTISTDRAKGTIRPAGVLILDHCVARRIVTAGSAKSPTIRAVTADEASVSAGSSRINEKHDRCDEGKHEWPPNILNDHLL
jgi:hypothetical protein